MKRLFLTLALIVSLGLSTTFAQEIPTLTLFHGAECPHCHKELKWLPKLEKMYPGLKVNEYEVWHNAENQALFDATMKELGQEAQGVPTNVIKDQVVVGFNPEAIVTAMTEAYGDPVEVVEESKPTLWQRIMDWFRGLLKGNW